MLKMEIQQIKLITCLQVTAICKRLTCARKQVCWFDPVHYAGEQVIMLVLCASFILRKFITNNIDCIVKYATTQPPQNKRRQISVGQDRIPVSLYG